MHLNKETNTYQKLYIIHTLSPSPLRTHLCVLHGQALVERAREEKELRAEQYKQVGVVVQCARPSSVTGFMG